jgi:hypothetical protein
VVYGIVDVVSRKWVVTLLTAEATATQVKVLFLDALDTEGLLEGLQWRLDQPGDVDLAEPAAPILLAVSDIHTRPRDALGRVALHVESGVSRERRRSAGGRFL